MGFLTYIITYSIHPLLLNSLYTVAGIMFSVGMSLVVTMSTQEIHNIEAKREVQSKIQKLLNRYILNFGVLTTMYILLPSKNEQQVYDPIVFPISEFKIRWDYSYSFLVYLIYNIIYYIENMLSIRHQNYEIENLIEQELDS